MAIDLEYTTELDLVRAGVNILDMKEVRSAEGIVTSWWIFYEFQYNTPAGGVKWSRQMYCHSMDGGCIEDACHNKKGG